MAENDDERIPGWMKFVFGFGAAAVFLTFLTEGFEQGLLAFAIWYGACCAIYYIPRGIKRVLKRT